MSDENNNAGAMTDDAQPSSSENPPANSNGHDSAPTDGNNGAPSTGGGTELKLYIGNIDYSTDEARLRETFSKYGTITDCFCPVDRSTNRPRGFGFVTFASSDDAQAAIAEMDNTELDGRSIRVSESRPKEVGGRGGGGGGGFSSGEFNSSGATEVKLFVGNLAFETDVETIRELFEKEGEVVDCYMPKDRNTDQPRGFAFVTMPAEDAKGAMKKFQGHEVDGRTLRIEESMPRRDVSRGGGGGRGFGGGGGGFGERDTYPPRGGGFDSYAGGRDRYDDRGGGGGGGGGYGRDRYGDRDSHSRGRDRYDDRESYSRGRDRYDDDRGDRSSRDDRGSRYDDRGDRKGSYSRDREDRYRSGDRDRDRDSRY